MTALLPLRRRHALLAVKLAFYRPQGLDVIPRSDDPRWLALGYNPKWPHLGNDPKWQSFGYEPQYNGFQPPATLRRFRSTQSLPAELHRLPSEDG